MEKFYWQYPDDEVEIVQKMTGREFLTHIRGNQLGVITLYSLDSKEPQKIFFDAILCDFCNKSIDMEDTCYLLSSHLLCQNCWGSNDQYRLDDIKDDVVS